MPLLFLFILLFLTAPAFPAASPVTGPKGTVTPRTTIERCLAELKNSNPQIRRSAVLVLGKYTRDPIAFQGLLDCLKDRDAEIRQTALVSLTEGTFIRPAVRPHIYPLFQDPDVHIRRISTSLLRTLSARGYGYFFMRRSSSSRDQDELSRLARKHANLALKDSDYSVRRNVLAGAVYRPDLIEDKNLLPFFKDSKNELVILALQIFRQKPGKSEEKLRILKPLTGHSDAEIRQLAAEQLVLLSGYPAVRTEILPVLRKLLTDSSAQVRAIAVRGIMLTGSDELLPRLEKILQDRSLPENARRSLIILLKQHSEKALPILQNLLKSSQPFLREEAMRVLSLFPQEHLRDEVLLQALSDESQSIRRQAVLLLRRRRHVFQESELAKLLKSPHPDIRRAVLVLLPGNSPLLKEAVLELCMDDDQQVRIQALSRLPAIRPEGWTEILTASLEDDSSGIQETAARSLLPLNSPEILQALRLYLPRCRNSYLKRQLEMKLKNHR